MNEKRCVPGLRVLVLIATPKLTDRAFELLSDAGLTALYRFNAHGTASSETMDMLGLGSTDKGVLICLAPAPASDETLKQLRRRLKLGSVNSGVAFSLPISGSSKYILRMLTELGNTGALPEGKESSNMSEMKYAMVAAIINQGFSEDVMEAARAVGAGGGTVFHSRHIAGEEALRRWGLGTQTEKEIVLILTAAEGRLPIMRAISESCGVKSKAKGLVLSLPVESVMGLALEE